MYLKTNPCQQKTKSNSPNFGRDVWPVKLKSKLLPYECPVVEESERIQLALIHSAKSMRHLVSVNRLFSPFSTGNWDTWIPKTFRQDGSINQVKEVLVIHSLVVLTEGPPHNFCRSQKHHWYYPCTPSCITWGTCQSSHLFNISKNPSIFTIPSAAPSRVICVSSMEETLVDSNNHPFIFFCSLGNCVSSRSAGRQKLV